MKWLRSSLFKNNSDTFVFEEKINVNVGHYDNSLKDIRDVFKEKIKKCYSTF